MPVALGIRVIQRRPVIKFVEILTITNVPN